MTAIGEEVRQRISTNLTKKGQSRSDVVAIKCNDKDGSCLLFVKPEQEGEHLLSVIVSGQHVPNSPFLLPVNNRDYYRSTFKHPVQTIDIGSPSHVAFSSNGDMFVTSDSTHSIHVYDKHDQMKNEIGKQGDGDLEFSCPRGITVVAVVAFVSDSQNHRIQKFSLHGKFLTIFGSRGSGDGQLDFPYGLTIGADRMIYVSDSNNERITVFSEVGLFVHNIDVSASVRGPWGLTISADGNLHVSGYRSGNYTVFSPAGNVLMSHGFPDATGVAIDAAGFVLAVSQSKRNNSLSIFNDQGEVIHTIKMNRPCGVAIAPDGSVWVAETYGKLYKF